MATIANHGRRRHPLIWRQLFSTSRSSANKQLPPRIKINEEDLIENFIKGGGKGGQKINKTNSLVQLIHKPTDIHVRCQATRSRSQNRTVARRILAERIEELEKGDESRTSIKAEKVKKKKASAIKKKRRKYRGSEHQEDDPDDSDGDDSASAIEDAATTHATQDDPFTDGTESPVNESDPKPHQKESRKDLREPG